jgi:hypothetical protein
MYNSAIVNSNNRYNLEFCLYLDWDDKESLRQLIKNNKPQIPLTKITIGNRIKQSAMWNNAASLATGDIMMQCADDAIFLTKNWDTLITKAFNHYSDKIALVWGDDGHHGQNLATLGFIHRKWYETVGYFVPPLFDCWYSDTWLTSIAKALNRTHYIPHLKIDHQHPTLGKADWDDTYTYRLNENNLSKNNSIFQDTTFSRRMDVLKLKHYIQSQKS